MEIKKVGDGLFLPGESTPEASQQPASSATPLSNDVLETAEPPDMFSTFSGGESQAFTISGGESQAFTISGGESQAFTIGGDSLFNTVAGQATIGGDAFSTVGSQNVIGSEPVALPGLSLTEDNFEMDPNGRLVLNDEQLSNTFKTALDEAKSRGANTFQFVWNVKLKGE